MIKSVKDNLRSLIKQVSFRSGFTYSVYIINIYILIISYFGFSY